MSDINSVFNNAELAFAAYANFENNTQVAAAIAALTGMTGGAMTQTEAVQFAVRYPTVVMQTNDDSTGFSATVFRDTMGNLTVAFRGVESGMLNDLAAGADILSAGVAYTQIVAMVNWWRRISAPAGQEVDQYRLATYVGSVPEGAVVLRTDGLTSYVLENAPRVAAETGTNNLSSALAADSDGRVDLTGHSLGGHLAMAFGSIFSAQSAQTTVFNAPGFTNTAVNQAFFAKLGGSVPTNAAIVNVAGDEALVDSNPFNWIAGLWSRPGEQVNIPIERQTNSDEPAPFSSGNHSMALLVDSLAVYKLLKDLAPTLSEPQYKLILNQAAQGTAAGYEYVVDALRVLFKLPPAELVPGNNPPNREALYQAIYGLRNTSTYDSRIGLLDLAPTQDSATILVANAQLAGSPGLAHRYALSTLAPFVILGSAAESLYTAHNQSGELDFFDPVTRTGALTDTWLQDRAAFLERKLYVTGLDRNQYYEDPALVALGTTPNPPDERGRAYQLQAKHFEDRASGFVASTGGNPNALQFFVFGDARANAIVTPANGREDHLYGGGGSDFLAGGYGDDYLEGGAGLDVYQYSASQGLLGAANDGADQIRDIDGKGILRYTYSQSGSSPVVRSTSMAGVGVQMTATEWQSPDGKFTYRQESGALVVAINGDAAGSIRILDFDFAQALHSSYLGIRLVSTPSALPGHTNLFVGDKQDFDAVPSEPGVQTQTDAFGNVVRDPTLEEPNRADTFLGSSAAEVDRFQTAGGNDAVFADGAGSAASTVGGADWVQLGGGRDFTYGGAGNDLVEGGTDGEWTYTDSGGQVVTEAGGDVLQGGTGTDLLYGGAQRAFTAAILAGENDLATDAKGDFLSGGAGADWLVGDAGEDLLFGGGAGDIIVAGAGDDTIASDQGYETTSLLWQVSRTTTDVPDGRNSYVADYSDNLTLGDTTAGGADAIYAGGGDDWVFAGLGDDYVDSGSGKDLLLGMEGADVLIGGAGNDDLWGDLGHEAIAELWGDYLDGGEGNDTLWGDWGDDVLIGGPGDDKLYGGSGAGQFAGLGKDIYIFNRGDGRDELFDDSIGPEASVLVFGEGFNPADLKVRPGSMILDFGQGDSVHLMGFDAYDANSAVAFESLSFADSSVLSFQDVLDLGFDIDGTEGDDDGHDAAHPVLFGTAFRDNIRGFGGNDELQGLLGNDVLDGGAGDDRISGGEGNDSIQGGDGTDALVGDNGADALSGGDGSDYLWGGTGDDVLDGGAGADTLIGQGGNDSYVFGQGDFAFDFEGQTKIIFGAGITSSDVALRLQFVNTLATYTVELNGATSDAERMFIQLSNPTQLAAFEFADGTVLNHEELLRETSMASQAVIGTAADESLSGYAGRDVIRAGAGNDTLSGRRGEDTLQGEAGDDTLDGGAGNDSLDGGDGSDVYLVRQGEGADTIFEANVAGQDVLRFTDVVASGTSLARRANGDLVVTVLGGSTVTITGQYNGAANGVERIEFADNAVLLRADLDALTVAPIQGTPGDDVLTGTSFDDTLLGHAGADRLDGGAGDDVLDGGSGLDTYVLGGLPGYDTVVESGAEASAIRLSSGVEFDDVRSRRQGNDLILSIRNVDGGLILPGYYTGATNWTVSSDTESSIAVATLLDYIENITPADTPAEVEAEYIDAIELEYAIYLQHNGRTGGIQINVQPPTDAAVIQREPPDSETTSNGQWFLNVADITGGASANTLHLRQAHVVIADASGGDDLIDNQGFGFRSSESDTEIGSYLYGNDGNDRILGNWAADWLLGGGGNDYLSGSDGHDTYIVFASDPGIDVIDEAIEDVYLGGVHFGFAGGRDSTDTLKLVDVDFSDATFSVGQYDSNAVNFNGDGRLYTSLDISWGTERGVRVLLPDENNTYLNQFPGHSYGIESIVFGDGTTLSLNQIFSEINAQTIGAPGDEATVNGTEAGETLGAPIATSSPLRFYRSTLNGLGGNDTLFGGLENDVLNGGAGDDFLSGEAGDDVLHGGVGNDALNGFRGNDVYLFNLGDGRDSVSDGGGHLRLEENKDVLRFGEGIAPSSVGVTHDGWNLHLTILGSQDRVTLSQGFSEDAFNSGVDRVEFANGTVWSRAELAVRAGVVPGSAFDDVIGGTLGNDVINGQGGDDLLVGMAGNDILRGGDGVDDLEEWDVDPKFTGGGNNLIDGGAGDDYVYHEGHSFIIGGAGHDWLDVYGNDSVIAFNAGDGSDTVYVAGGMTLSLGGIAPASLVLSEDGTDLVLTAGADSVRFSRQFESDPRAWPQMRLQIIGSDIRTYDLDSVFAAFYVAQGGNPGFQMALDSVLPQHLIATSSNQAVGGDLAYAYAHGELATGLSDADIQRVLSDANFGAQSQFIERAPAAPVQGGDNGGVLTGTSSPEQITGGAGNDFLNGGGGEDTLAGGAGNDLLLGGAGADTYVYNLGGGVDTIADPTAASGDANTLQLGSGITSDDITLGLGSLVVRVGDAGGALHLTSFDPNSPFGVRDINAYRFADGTTLTYEQLLARGFDLVGTGGADLINGTATIDRIRGGAGADVLAGALGSDVYFYNTGDGADVIQEGADASVTDVLRFGSGITSTSLGVARDLNDIVITLPTAGDQVRLTGWFATAGGTIERVEFADGSFWTAAELEGRSTNQAPVVATPIPDQTTNEDAAFSFAVPTNTFSDPNAGDTLAYAATRQDGSALPAWLSFDANTATFSGTPANGDVGSIAIRVTATDDGGEAVFDDFILSVANTNDTPTLANAIADQSATEDAAFAFTVPADAFADVDLGDALTYGASRADGTALPSWLSFDAQTRAFTGTPLNADVGSLEVRVTATDGAGASASDVFTISVANTNDAPTVANPIADQSATETLAFNYTVPANAFADVDAGDVLTYSATRVDGSALPAWLAFDAPTRTFTGTPPDGSVGSVGIRVTATDQSSTSAFDDFTLDIANFVILGTAGNDTLTGTAGNDEMDGLAGNDTISGAAGNDILRGGAGNDSLEGQDGDDYLDGGATASGINNLNGGSGNDIYRFSHTMGRADILDVPDQASTITADRILVDADILPSEIQLGRLVGNEMWLTLAGSPDVVMIVQSQFDKSTPGIATVEFIEFLADGTVWDFATMKSKLGTPTQGADLIRGFDDVNDTLLGLGGNDQLYGQRGNDTLEGGLGDDVVSGASGDDTYIFRRGDGQDSIDEQDFGLGEGNDTLHFTNILPSEVSVIKDLQFGALILRVNGSTDQVLINRYFANRPWDVVEQIRFQDGTVWTSDTIDERVAINGTSAANTLQGTEFIDRVKGLGGNDTLYGLGNDDWLDGGAGSDVMYGGHGDDTFVVDVSGDILVESAGEGTDTVRSSLSWTLGSNLENLTLTGSSALNGTGNSLSNTIIGNTGRNTLNGGAGNDWLEGGGNRDTLVGGIGNDIYVVDSTDDVITENANEGSDQVRSSIAWTLGTNLENLALTGTANINGTGNTLSNALNGNSGNNLLTGNAGNDTLEGFAGTDTLVGGTGNDTYRMRRGHGTDLVQENDATAGNTDTGQFAGDISEYQIWFQRTGNDLVASIIGTPDKLTVQNWYVGSQHRLEQFNIVLGKTLLESQVQNLVNAMAAFSPPAPGQETLPANYAAALNPVIAANWQ